MIPRLGVGIGNISEQVLTCNPKSPVTFEPSDNMFLHLHKRFAENNTVFTSNRFFEELADNYTDAFDSVLLVNVLGHIEDE